MDGKTMFFSPCQAGCKNFTLIPFTGKEGKLEEKRIFSDCSCVADASKILNTSKADPWWNSKGAGLPSPLAPMETNVFDMTNAVEGFCPFDCNQVFLMMIGALALLSILNSTGRVGNQLLTLRAVETRDKAASLAIMVTLLSVFVFLPSPIVFGAIIDHTCLVWGDNC